MRPRTDAAAWRSERFSANCKIVTNAKRQGVSAGCPRRGNSSANIGSAKTRPSVSRSCIASVTLGNAARATRMVSSGMDVESVDWSDISDLLLGRLSLPSLQPISPFGNRICCYGMHSADHRLYVYLPYPIRPELGHQPGGHQGGHDKPS